MRYQVRNKSPQRILRLILLVLLPVLCCGTWAAEALNQPALPQVLEMLKQPNFNKKRLAVENLAKLKNSRSLEVMQALLEGRLYYRRSDKKVVILQPQGGRYRMIDAVTGGDLGMTDKSGLARVTINNRIRSFLRNALARLSLTSDDPAVRLAAVKKMYDRLTPNDIELLQSLLAQETDSKVREAIRVGLALAWVVEGEDRQRLEALKILSKTTSRKARNRIAKLLEKSPDGSYVIETSYEVRVAARKALAAIDQRMKSNAMLQTFFFGLSLGSVLLLSAIGLAITFGVMGVINMAHGEMMMLGAYTTYLIQHLMPNNIDLSVLIAIPAAFLVSGLVGIAIERGVIRHLYGRPLETLLATFGISLLLQQLVRTTISAQNVMVTNPSWMSGALEINEVLSFTYNRIAIFFFALIVFLGLSLLLRFTSFGLQIRAVAQNRAMARALGIRSHFVDAATFGLGSGIAGVAGVALSQITNVGPNLGQGYIIDSFMVVVFGGVGNLWGTLVGAFSLGIINKLLEPWVGAVMAKIMVLVFIILFIQKFPRGLFPQRGRAAEN